MSLRQQKRGTANERAYSVLTLKSVTEENGERIIEGIATTPTPDRVGDIVEPEGAEFTLPIPLLWQHNSSQPVGHVISAKVTKEGITIRARFVKVDEDGDLKKFLDFAWQSVKATLVRGLSIGFKPLEEARLGDTWSFRFLKWAWLELSCVTIPANTDASITAIKSADESLRAALGARQKSVSYLLAPSTPGASGTTAITSKGNENMKTLQEQIASWEAKRAATAAAMQTILEKAEADSRTLDKAESDDYDAKKDELASIDTHIARLKASETLIVKGATAIVAGAGASAAAGSDARGGVVISTKRNLAAGVPFVRYVQSLARAKGSLGDAFMLASANELWKDTPEVAAVLKAAVAAGTTTDATWAGPLFDYTTMAGEFIEYLRPQTVLGKMGDRLRRVPFNVRMSSQTSGSSAAWVGQGAPIPVSKAGFNEVTLAQAKASGLVVLTEELVRASAPSAELVMRKDLGDAIVQFLDAQFLDPGIAEVANVSPASITQGVSPIVPSGTNAAALRDDVQDLFQVYIDNNLDPSGAVWIMPATLALALSLMQNALGQPEFPGITMTGGTFFGLPVIVSQSAYVSGSPTVGNLLIIANCPEIMLADDGQIVIDASREASLQMLDNPTNNAATGTATTMVSMFQTNSVALRAIRFINWKKRRAQAVAYVSNAQYRA